jgi:hypothetical protein
MTAAPGTIAGPHVGSADPLFPPRWPCTSPGGRVRHRERLGGTALQQTWPPFLQGAAAFALATTSRLRRRPGRVVHVLGTPAPTSCC